MSLGKLNEILRSLKIYRGGGISESRKKYLGYNDNVTTYISGFIQKKILKKVNCSFCRDFITDGQKTVSCDLIDVKRRGKLINPCSDFKKWLV